MGLLWVRGVSMSAWSDVITSAIEAHAWPELIGFRRSLRIHDGLHNLQNEASVCVPVLRFTALIAVLNVPVNVPTYSLATDASFSWGDTKAQNMFLRYD